MIGRHDQEKCVRTGTAGEQGRTDSEGPQRKVTFAKAFAVGKFEVTFAEWDACVAGGGCTGNKSPSDAGWGRGRRPVINVSWDDAKEYVAWLSRKTGKTYRLLSEAEWEYAARGVTSASTPSKRYWWGDQASHEYANFGNSGGHKEGRDRWENTAPVGQFPANPFGVSGMLAAVWIQTAWGPESTGKTRSTRQGDMSCAIQVTLIWRAFAKLTSVGWSRLPTSAAPSSSRCPVPAFGSPPCKWSSSR